MFDLIASILAWLYDLTSSYGLAIALLTLGVLVVATPLTLKGTASMLKMQILQPEMKAIQNKYPADKREEMNAELLEFYKANNINPVGGCMPMLFQIPVFLVLYRIILGLTRRATDVGIQLGTVFGATSEGTTADPFVSTEDANFNPAYLDETSNLYIDLSATNEMNSFGFDLSRSASNVLTSDGILSASPYLALVLIVGASGYVQHHMIRRRSTGAPVNPTQEMLMKIMPWFLPIFSFTLPAAIVIYFFVSNLYRIGQQWYITHSMYKGDDSLGAQVQKARETDVKGKGKSSGKGGNSGGKASNKSTKSNSNKNSNKKSSSSGARKAGSNANKKKSSTAVKAGAPGRNRSGTQASARTQVEPKARKKKKR
jgi:YidC/Oxa1 family membrane protein insertase